MIRTNQSVQFLHLLVLTVPKRRGVPDSISGNSRVMRYIWNIVKVRLIPFVFQISFLTEISYRNNGIYIGHEGQFGSISEIGPYLVDEFVEFCGGRAELATEVNLQFQKKIISPRLRSFLSATT